MKLKRLISRIIQNIFAWIITLIILIPLIVILVNAFKSQSESAVLTLSLPAKFLFSNFSTVINRGNLINAFSNSLTYASFSTILVILVTSMASYVLIRNRNKLNRFLYYFFVLGIALPINYLALMKVMIATHLMNTTPGIILIYISLAIPFDIFIFCGFIDTIPKELDEAAVIDGCSPLSLFFRIVFPLLTPVLVTVFVLNFLGTWNDFNIAIYFLNGGSKMPMTLAVYNFFGMYSQSWNLVCADIVLTSLPVLIIFIVGQKYIISGLTSGAVKG